MQEKQVVGRKETRIAVFLCMFQIMMTLMLPHWQVVQNSTHTHTHTDTHKQTQITTTAFSSLSSNSFRDIRNSQRENGPRQISFGDKSDGRPMDVTTALGCQTGHKGSECFKTQQSAHWDYMHYRTGYEIASSHKLVLIHAAHCQCSSRFAKIHCEANSLSVQEPASH